MLNPITHIPVSLFLGKLIQLNIPFNSIKKNKQKMVFKEVVQSHSYYLSKLCKEKNLEIQKKHLRKRVSINYYPIEAYSEYYSIPQDQILSWFKQGGEV
jgi:hypothetical protein